MKLLLGCTKAGPFLVRTESIVNDTYELFDTLLEVDKYQRSLNPDMASAQILNGSVCIECDCNEVFDISKVVQTNKNLSLKIRGVYDTEEVMLYRGLKTALTLKQIEVYQGDSKTLYAYHFENVKPIDPMPITQLYKDEACTTPLTRAPQSYCHVYWNHLVYHDWHDPKKIVNLAQKTEEAIYFSVQSPWLCKIGNGEKDLEVRKTRIAEGVEYK
jgi:hypothetical protein